LAPAVVNITTRTYQRGFFFEPIPAEGAGSGFVLDDEGPSLTNYHVIQDAERVEVNFDDNTTVQAQIVGVDPRNDVALLQVDASPDVIHPVTLGTSANLQVGQRAIAIGNPFGQFGRTLTTGVISALDRTLKSPDKRTITGVIQTDAAINRGNSGGPLLDSAGKVIGITTAIFSPTGASAGIGFAIPIDKVKRILPDMLELGRYRHPWLGMRYAYTITPGLAEMLDLPVERGLLLVQLAPNSPLADAGAREAQQKTLIGNQIVYVGGDILTAIDGQPVSSWEDLQTLLEDNYQVGDTVTVTLRQEQTTLEVEVTLEEEGT
jgi:S1-C subfamily serine protease